MTHWDAYHKGKITLKQARQLSALKLSNPRKYRKEEKRLGI